MEDTNRVLLSRFDVGMTWKKVVSESPDLLCVKSEAWSRFVVLMAMLLAFLFAVFFLFFIDVQFFIELILISVSIFFLLLGLRNYLNISSSFFLDKKGGVYFIQNGLLLRVLYMRGGGKGRLDEVIGIQLLEKRLYSRYRHGGEVNFLLRDGTRVHLYVSGNMHALVNDVKRISEFLKIPIRSDYDYCGRLSIGVFRTNIRWAMLIIDKPMGVMRFRSTKRSILLALLPAVSGLIVLGLTIFVYITIDLAFVYLLLALLFALLMILMSFVIIKNYGVNVIFDKNGNLFKKGSLLRWWAYGDESYGLEEIYAFQVLRVLAKIDWKHFDCWELNIILSSERRVHLFCTGGGAIRDVEKLAKWLDKPVYVSEAEAMISSGSGSAGV